MNDLLSLQYTDTVLSGTKSSYSSDERLQELSGKNLANLVVQDIQQAVDNNHDLQFHCNAGANRAPTQALGMLIASNQLDMLNVAHIGMCAAITTDTTRSPFTTMQPLNIHTLLYIAAFIKAGYVIDHNRLLKFKEIMNDSDLQECSRWHGY
jgi:hypothetical protein